MKALIVYYSLTGKTEMIAQTIAKTLKAEIRKVEEIKKRNFFGLIRGVFEAIKGKGSKIKPMDFNLTNYDLIFLGTPVWAFKPAPAINAFISKADFKDKKIILFVTMGGVGGKSAIKTLINIIESKGGKVINSFAIKTGGVEEKEIIEKGNEIGREYRI
ncbi:MAG: NAD(P)H-dependent oxidoreductase [candidate division WOR-3 bacterium]|nr:NAD(P)H-dependent oxidoreductase [candidate division WOR-3 bacterium]